MGENWKENIKYNGKVYSDDRIIQGILEKLGTTKNIAKNLYVIEKVTGMLYEIMLQREFEISGVNVGFDTVKGECEESEIEKIARLLTNNEEKAEKVLGDEYSISVDSSTQ